MSKAVYSGHGRTLHLAVIDEAWAETDDRKEQALVPAMTTVDDAQMLILSTAGEPGGSDYWRNRLDGAREGLGDPSSRICLVHYAADPAAGVDDQEAWGFHPALRTEANPAGTISVATMAHALRVFRDEGAFRRHYFNQEAHDQAAGAVPGDAWAAAQTPDMVRPEKPRSYAVHADPDRRVSVIVAADHAGRVELVQQGAGTDWLVGRLQELEELRPQVKVAVATTGPLGFLIPAMEAAHLTVREFSATDLGYAAGYFGVELEGRRLQVRPHAAFDQAVATTTRRTLSGQHVFQDSDMAAPLIAAAMACWLAHSEPPETPTPFAFS
jgi:hypothetical protein